MPLSSPERSARSCSPKAPVRRPIPTKRLWLAGWKEAATSHLHSVELVRDRVNEIALRSSLRAVSQPKRDSVGTSEADWRLTAALLEELRSRVHETGAALRLVIVPSREQVLGTKPVSIETDVHQRLLRWAAERSLPVVDLLPALQSTAAGGSPYYRVDAHWNARGHEAAAQAIARALGGPSS